PHGERARTNAGPLSCAHGHRVNGMANTPLHTQFSSIQALREALQAGQLSATELAHSALEAIEARKDLNAFLHVDADLTLEQARNADAAIKPGMPAVITGVPIAHKDVLVTKGRRRTAPSRMLAIYVSPFDATVVSRRVDASPVEPGNHNCDEFAMSCGNETPGL